MSFRLKLLAIVTITLLLTVAAVTWVVTFVTRRAFERADEQRTTALVEQFQRQFQQQAADLSRRVSAAASSDTVSRIALSLSRESELPPAFLHEAGSVAETLHLDFLEFTDRDGTILSSAQTPAKFGYPDTSLRNLTTLAGKPPFLKQEELPDGSALGLFVVRASTAGDQPVYVIGGERLDSRFLSTLQLPPGMHAALLPTQAGSALVANSLIDPAPNWTDPAKLADVVTQSQQQSRPASALIHWSDNPAGDEVITAIPLNGQDEKPLAVLLVSSSRRPYVELRSRIESVALLVGGGSVLLGLLLSAWAAARMTRPLEQFAAATREVASGNMGARVDIHSSDEIGDLAQAFNRMTADLQDQKHRLIQTERVAAWRELARRLAHELKNPLFPLQLTVENLMRAREQHPTMFDEMFHESSATLLAEIQNLKSIISRFSEFSKMPEPRFQRVDVNELVRGVARLHQSQLEARPQGSIRADLDMDSAPLFIAADSEMLHRAISNLVLNAIDAMPQGGTLALRTRSAPDGVTIQVCDTGTGLTPEECERLFTPYYTSKQHGTGLGLAIVQSVVSDHGGRIDVRSRTGEGTTFVITLPANSDRLAQLEQSAERNPPTQPGEE